MNNYLLDTNIYFKLIYFLTLQEKIEPEMQPIIDNLLSSNCYISQITLIEIISVIGKHARQNPVTKEKCQCKISEAGDICQNYRYYSPSKKLNKRVIRDWMKLIKDISSGTSSIIHISILPLTNDVLKKAEHFIQHAMHQKFGSLDAIIAGTALNYADGGQKLTILTSDKGFRAGMALAKIDCMDCF